MFNVNIPTTVSTLLIVVHDLVWAERDNIIYFKLITLNLTYKYNGISKSITSLIRAIIFLKTRR